MKKRLLTTISILSLSAGAIFPSMLMVSCNKKDGPTIKFTEDSYQVERGQTLSITVKVDGIDKDKDRPTANFEIIEGEDFVTAVNEDKMDGVKSITVKGRKPGKAKIRATATASKKLVAEIEVECIGQIKALNEVWTNVIKNTNYTFYSFDSEDEERTPLSTLKVTEKAATFVDKDGKGFYHYAYAKKDADGKPINDEDGNPQIDYKTDVVGIAIGKDDLAYYVEKKEDGTFLDTISAIQTTDGFLKSNNFLGTGESQSNPNSSGLIYGLQAINPKWLYVTQKIDGNDYDVNYDEDAGTADENPTFERCFVESMLWYLVEPVSYTEYMTNDKTSKYFTDMADQVDTHIRAVNNNTIEVSLTVGDVDDGGKTYIGRLKDVGSTTLDSNIQAQVDANATKEVKADPLESTPTGKTMKKIKDAFTTNDYVTLHETAKKDETSILGNTWQIYTPNYLFFHYDEDYKSYYKSKYTKDLVDYGYAYADGGYVAAFKYDNVQLDNQTEKSWQLTNIEVAKDRSGNEIKYDTKEQFQEEFIAHPKYNTLFNQQLDDMLRTFNTLNPFSGENDGTVYTEDRDAADCVSFMIYGGDLDSATGMEPLDTVSTFLPDVDSDGKLTSVTSSVWFTTKDSKGYLGSYFEYNFVFGEEYAKDASVNPAVSKIDDLVKTWKHSA